MTTGKAVLITVGLLSGSIFLGAVFEIGLLVPMMVFGTAVWAAIDSAKIGTSKYKTGISAGPVVVFIGCILLWIVVFPWYLISKGKIERGEAQLKDGQQAAVTPIQATPGRSLSGDAIQKLEKLSELKSKGILSEAEFNAQKEKLLG